MKRHIYFLHQGCFIVIFFFSLTLNAQDFILENKGQWEAEVKYVAHIPGGKIYFLEDSWMYHFYESPHKHEHEHELARHQSQTNHRTNEEMHSHEELHKHHVVRVKPSRDLLFPLNPKLRAEKKGATVYNYIYGDDPGKWVSHVHAYQELVYENIYEGIDLRFYLDAGQLKYDFEIKKGAKARDIHLHFEGADALEIKDARLHIHTSLGEMVEDVPYSYRRDTRRAKEIPTRYKLQGNVLSYAFPRGTPAADWTLDPAIIFSTFSGSTSDNWGFTATYDEEGSLYSGGIAFSTGFPSTIGAYQQSFGGGVDLAILKFDSSGTRLVYATYLGGSSTEVPQSLIVNEQNELLILGVTGSSNFPTTRGAIQRVFNGGKATIPVSGISFQQGTDLFVAKLSADGSSLLSSTYLGGSENDGTMEQFWPLTKNYGDQFRGDILVDSLGDIYIGSHTQSSDFPHAQPIQGDFAGGRLDGIVAKMSADLSMLYWSSYIGGSADDAFYSVKFDKDLNVFVAGGTTSDDFPASAGAFSEEYSGNVDGILVKIKHDGTEILGATYFGGSSYDQIYFIDLDAQGNPYALGQSQSVLPISPGKYGVSRGGIFYGKRILN